MGSPDGLWVNVVGAASGGGAVTPISLSSRTLVGGVLSLVRDRGGLEGVIGALRQNGLSSEVDTWIGTGANAPVTAEQLERGLGASVLGALASTLGVSTSQAGATLAQLLPEVINLLTPAGTVPDDHEAVIARAIDALRGK
jgi:uncharacterized protein YidB (DUF937 family)